VGRAALLSSRVATHSKAGIRSSKDTAVGDIRSKVVDMGNRMVTGSLATVVEDILSRDMEGAMVVVVARVMEEVTGSQRSSIMGWGLPGEPHWAWEGVC
jgi:hypothetical protein